MSTTVNETESVKVNPKINSAVAAYASAEVKLDVAFDNVRNVAKSETVKHSYTDKQLTSLLLEAGLNPARASEVKGFVFPAHNAARKELDRAMEMNAKQTDAKKRIAKPVILALQRDKEGTLTLEQAIADHKAKDTFTRTPGGATNQSEKKDKAKTPEEIEEHLGNLCAAALNYAKANDYDIADFHAVCEVQEEIIYAESEPAEEEEAETETED